MRRTGTALCVSGKVLRENGKPMHICGKYRKYPARAGRNRNLCSANADAHRHFDRGACRKDLVAILAPGSLALIPGTFADSLLHAPLGDRRRLPQEANSSAGARISVSLGNSPKTRR